MNDSDIGKIWNIELRLTHFAPGLLVPLSSYPALITGFLLLFASIYTLTTTVPSLRTHCTLVRLALAPPAILLFWNFGFSTSYNPPGAQVAVGMAVVGTYGIMRVIDASIVPLIDPAPPVWVQTGNGMPLPLPTNTKDRLVYSLDLATSLRGTSWFAGRHWNWAPTPLLRATTAHMTCQTFLSSTILSLLGQYLAIDILDSINKSRLWDTSERFPITTLSILEQSAFSISVCGGTVLSISITYSLISLVAVALGSPPASWPPMFNQPFRSTSLADFWTHRWHAIFRRVFTRLSLLALALLPVPGSYLRTRTVVRAISIFTLSASLHVMLMYRLERDNPSHPSLMQTFLDPSILAFFLAQPFGLAFEALIVRPLVLRVASGEKVQTTMMRVWAWGFMLWAGRFWSDVWVRRGLWAEDEHVVGYSLVRGLLKGQWKA